MPAYADSCTNAGQLDHLDEAVERLEQLKDIEAVWSKIGQWQDRVARLADTERRLLYEEKRAITGDRMLTIQNMFLNWAKQLIESYDGRVVESNKMLRDTQMSFAKLFTMRDQTPVLPVQAKEVSQ